MSKTATKRGRLTGRSAPASSPGTVRVAIYGRKSVADRDQDFGSIDAQREAVEAYVASQRAQGWTVIPEHYDDGGFTGANTDRPAFKRLLADIEAGKVDAVATYKLDRLSRSLLDFAGLMKFFQARNIAFVSVTETFDTSTPMGRMVLNMLATFAQMERETIAERTRDKMAAARRKGLWTGGRPVLGFDVVDKRLVVNDTEAEQVRAVFQLYPELGSLIPAVEELARRGGTTKSWTNKAGKPIEGRPFTKNSAHCLLTNPLYIGRVRAGDEVVDGEHDAIVDDQTWERVQALLRVAAPTKNTPAVVRESKSGALLAGLLRCRCGSSMSHTYTKRGAKRYSYYICSRAQKQGAASCPGSRIAAGKLESHVVEQLHAIGRDPKLVEATITADRDSRAARKPELLDEVNRARQEVERIRRARRNVADAVAAGGAGQDALAEKMVELDDDLAQATTRFERANADLTALDGEVVDPEELRAALVDLEPLWAELFPRERARLVSLLLESVKFDAVEGEVDIVFRPGGPEAVRAHR